MKTEILPGWFMLKFVSSSMSKGGIHIPDTSEKGYFEVIEVGDKENKKYIGKKAIITIADCINMEHEGEKYLFVRKENFIGVMEIEEEDKRQLSLNLIQ